MFLNLHIALTDHSTMCFYYSVNKGYFVFQQQLGRRRVTCIELETHGNVFEAGSSRYAVHALALALAVL